MKPSKRTIIAVSIIKLLDTQEIKRSKSIAVAVGISFEYFNKIMLTLSSSGLSESVRGMNGGYKRRIKKISLWDVIQAFEPDVAKFYSDTWNSIYKAIKENAENTVI